MAYSNQRASMSFQNFDDPVVFNELQRLAASHRSLNFVIDFTASKASCAFDLDKSALQLALADREQRQGDHNLAQSSLGTRWINIWRPEEQKDIIKVKEFHLLTGSTYSVQLLAGHYGLSTRLALSMCCDPLRAEPAIDPLARTSHVRKVLHPRTWQAYGRSQTQQSKDSDVEGNEKAGEHEHSRRTLDLNHYRVVNEIWHFISVDWGHKYASIGFNQLYGTKPRIDLESAERQHGRPEGRRIWSWLVLCHDGTLISINENPFPYCDTLNEHQQYELNSIRQNLLNVFAQLSMVTDKDQPLNPIMTVQVRAGRKSSMAENQVHEADSPSLLLYYLFDDWYTSYSLVAKSDHEYRRQLNTIREEMFKSAQLSHVHNLHSLGHQLGVLNRVYEGYNLIIERIMNRSQQLNAPSMQMGRSSMSATDSSRETSSVLEQKKLQAEGYGVPISAAAALRFERLKDRIALYALSEIRSCLAEKDSLMSMNFNLVAIKEGSYVESLTRITILLAKITILFIPVSVLAAYFGINFTNQAFTTTQFWIWFAVIFFISVLGLVAFGYLSDTRESGPIYQSLTRTAVETWRAFTGKRANKKKA